MKVGPLGVAVGPAGGRPWRPDAVIDFSFHDAVPAHAEFCAGHGEPMVIGSTRLDGAERQRLREAARRRAIVWAPNMSVGVNLLFALVQKALATSRGGMALGGETDRVPLPGAARADARQSR